MSEELYNSNDYCSLAEQYEELKKENAELTADKAHLMNLFMESSEYIFDVVSNMKINDLERKCKALEADYVISNRELLILQQHIAELEAEIDQLTAHDATERKDDKWIPVSERLPEDRVTILAAFNNREILTAKYYKYYEGFGSVENYWRIECWHSGNVTHWMPLPEPPIVYGKECEKNV